MFAGAVAGALFGLALDGLLVGLSVGVTLGLPAARPSGLTPDTFQSDPAAPQGTAARAMPEFG
jgi:hypothetical protein